MLRLRALSAGTCLAVLAACGGGGGDSGGSGNPGAGNPGGPGAPGTPSSWTSAVAFGPSLGNAPREQSLAVANDARGFYLINELITPSPTTDVRAFDKPPGAGWSEGQVISPVIAVPSAETRAYESLHVRVDDAGRALAVWVYRDSLNPSDRNWTSNVFFSRRDPSSGTWGSPQVLQSDPLAHARGVHLVMEPSGSAWAVWTERTFKDATSGTQDEFAIFAARYDPTSGTWSTPEKVTTDMLWNVAARVATDRQGNPHVLVAWNSAIPLESTLLASRRTIPGTWTAPATLAFALPLASVAPSFAEFDIAVDADNDAIAMWREWDGIRHTVLSRHFTVAGGWEPAVQLMLASNDSGFGPKLAMDEAGNAFVAWHEFDDVSGFAIWTARFEKALGWTFLEIISSLPGTFGDDSTFPHIAFDSAGNAVAIWTRYEFLPNRPFVRANYYRHPTGWVGDETISTGAGIANANLADLAISSSGHAIATWWEEILDPMQPPFFRAYSATRPAP